MGYVGKKKRDYQKERVKRRREEYFKGKHREQCSSVDNLELHHKNPSEKISHSIWSWSEEKRNRELEKCKVLCKECHKKETRLFLSNVVHGTSNTYKGGCRCPLCKKAQIEYQKKYRLGFKPGNLVLDGAWYNPTATKI